MNKWRNKWNINISHAHCYKKNEIRMLIRNEGESNIENRYVLYRLQDFGQSKF
jgi:hypothetical protein